VSTAPAAQTFTMFLFIVSRDDGEASLTRLRAAGSSIARGFFNDYEAGSTRDQPPQETVQFLVAAGHMFPDSAIAAAGHVVHVTAKYRARLEAVAAELGRRLGDGAEIISLEGADRPPRYTSAELHDFANRPAAVRTTGKASPNAVILPISKTEQWWQKPALERQTYFYPHTDRDSGCDVPGHATAAAEGIPTIYRHLYHNPDGYQRPGEYDFITYFECADQHLDTFARVHRGLRDTSQNPEWRYVREGPLWLGRRVLKW
jgi:hypothetical protein